MTAWNKDAAGREAPDPDGGIETARKIEVYEEALQWLASHEGVSVAAARRCQRVAQGALLGRTPTEVLGGKAGR